MKNKPGSKVCCLAQIAKKNVLILVNNKYFYLELTLGIFLLGNEMINNVPVLLVTTLIDRVK